jgi:UDP-N-acetylmuramyl tripeptide synthase
MIQQTQPADTLVIAINDLDADGRDVSWLWDVDFEVLVDSEFDGKVITAGIRGYDMAVRMKYAGLDPERLDASVAGKRFDALLDHLKATSRPGERVFMLLTYTAMLELRRVLHERGAVKAFWDQ